MRKKILSVVCCTVLVAAMSILGTMSFLTDRDSVANTFTVGNVDIDLDEAKVDTDGQKVEPEERTEEGNEYHLVPGQTYTKDPTITVNANSEEAYVRMIVTINCLEQLDVIFAKHNLELLTIFNGYDSTIWKEPYVVRDEEKNIVSYEFRYKESVQASTEDLVLEPLFTSFTLPGVITGDELKTLYSETESLKIEVVGHAIQKATFESEEDAWEAFANQYPEL